jgi:hypothetical protein
VQPGRPFERPSFEHSTTYLIIDSVTTPVLPRFVTVGHKLVWGPRRDPLLPAVHSLLPPTPRICLSVFSKTCALFHFLDHGYPASFPQLAHSSAKNRGYTPAWSYHASPLSTLDCRLPVLSSPLTPFTASLTQKQGGRGYWSYHSDSLSAVSSLLDTHHFPVVLRSQAPSNWVCYSMERAAFLRHRCRRSANSHRKAFLP